MYVHTYLGVFAETARALFSDVHTNVVGKDKTASYSCKGGTGGGGSRVGWLGGDREAQRNIPRNQDESILF